MPKKSKVSLGDIADILRAGQRSEKDRSTPLGVLVVVDTSAARDVVLAVKDAFMPRQATATVRVESLAASEPPAPGWDAAVVVAGAHVAAAERMAEGLARCGVPVGLVVDSVLDLGANDLPEEVAALVSAVPASGADAVRANLADWLVDAAGEKGIAFAASFPFCRDQKVRELVRTSALENAAVGAVQVLPSADLPIMTVRQAKLALDVAAACGHPVSVASLADVAAVIAAGLAWREVARRATQVMPVPQWAVKAAVGFAGTVATGAAARLRNDPPALPDVGDLVAGSAVGPIVEAAARVASRAAKAVGERPGAASGQRQGEAPARADGARRTLPAPREATGRGRDDGYVVISGGCDEA